MREIFITDIGAPKFETEISTGPISSHSVLYREVSPTHDAAVEGLILALEKIATVKTVGYTEARKARKVAQDALIAYEASKK